MMKFYEYLAEAKKTNLKEKSPKANLSKIEVNEPKEHNLSGVVLIYDNKILLVRPKKFRTQMKKWSIPKGHIEAKMSKIKTALKELQEEATLKLKKSHLKKGEKVEIQYIKSGVVKKMTCYVVKISKEEMNVRLFNNMILGNFLKGETVEAGFFEKRDAKKIIEKHQLGLLKFLDQENG